MNSLQLASVHLRVSHLARSVEFYTRLLGFVVVNSTPARAELAAAPAGPALLVLSGDPAAPPAPRDAAGLFHAALLLPSRAALGAWLKHAAKSGVEFDGFSDHGVSEAIYFSDPDGNGLEFYADRPRGSWHTDANGELAMNTEPLDVQSLLDAALPPSLPLLADATSAVSAPAVARWGHLHLRVTDLDRSDAFYRATLGMVVTQSSFPGARFLAADGYHHHLGLNIWGRPRVPRPPAALGLVEATFARTGLIAAQHLADPDGIALHVVPSTAPSSRLA